MPSFIQCRKQITLSSLTLWYGPTYAFGFCLPRTCRSEYGVDEETKIPESRLTLCNHHLQEVSANISPLLDYVNEGKDVHKEALEKIDNAIENLCCNTT